MTQVLAIVFLLLWLGFSLFYSFSRDWFGGDGIIGRTLGAICMGCLTVLGIFSIGIVLLLLISAALGI